MISPNYVIMFMYYKWGTLDLSLDYLMNYECFYSSYITFRPGYIATLCTEKSNYVFAQMK